MIHCIGDSHSSVFSGLDEMQPIWPQRSNDTTSIFKSYRIGPATAYNLNNKTHIIDEILTSCVNMSDDYVLFCFGEVDVRAHISKHMIEKNINNDSLIIECVNRYFEIITHYSKLGYKIMVWGVIPSWSEEKPYVTGPTFGDSIFRNTITKKFNTYLEGLCVNNNIKFISIFSDLVNDNLQTESIFLDDWDGCHIHLNQKTMRLIIDKFKLLNLT